MSAPVAAAAMARGVYEVFPGATCVQVPMADGGEGTASALVAAVGGVWRQVAAHDALDRPIVARYGILPGGEAVMEVAAAVGLEQIHPAERDIMESSSRGVGDIVSDALDSGVTRFIIGLGGSATTDGGAGMLDRLGAVWRDADGNRLRPTPAGLATLDRVDLAGLDSRLETVRIDLACDVTNPLLGDAGSAAIFGPQKGARPEQVTELDHLLGVIADALTAAGRPDVRDSPGSGAAGGLGAALLSLGATRHPGVGLIADAAGLDPAMAGADLVLTGEGALDRQTRAGKTPSGVAAVAASRGIPVLAFTGRLGDGADLLEGEIFSAIWSIVPGPCSLEEALRDGEVNLERAVVSALRAMRLGSLLRE